MMRELAPLAAIGLVLVPDGASAFFGRRLFSHPCAHPVPVPVYVCPPVILVPPCLPYFPVVPANPVYVAPAVEPVPSATPTPATPSGDAPKTPRVSIQPAVSEPVRPASNTVVPRSEPVAPPVAATPPAVKPSNGFIIPELKSPAPQPTTPSGGGLNIPATLVPGGRPAEPTPPKTTADKPATPAPRLLPATDSGDLPPLALPDADRIARSSPIRSRPAFEVFPAAGLPTEGVTTRTVDFTNLTGRVVKLTVEGKSATLPDRSTLSATLPAEFRWKLDDGGEVVTIVPDGAPGADVLLRR